jgi:hypothetical protein
MKPKLIALLAILAVVGWVTVAAATLCDFYLTDSNLSNPGTPPYAEVIVTTNGTTATIEIKAMDNYYFDSAGVNLAINSDPLSNGYTFISATQYGGGPLASTDFDTPGSKTNQGGFGDFNFFIPSESGANFGHGGFIDLKFSVNTSLSCDQVLAFNSDDNLAIVHYSAYPSGNNTGFASGVTPVPLPPSALLLGSGLIGLGLLGWRRKIM